VPSLSHHLLAVTAEVVTFVAGAVVELDFVLHDTNIKDIIIRQLKIKIPVFPFIFAPYILLKLILESGVLMPFQSCFLNSLCYSFHYR
jgi:hypothetical protein